MTSGWIKRPRASDCDSRYNRPQFRMTTLAERDELESEITKNIDPIRSDIGSNEVRLSLKQSDVDSDIPSDDGKPVFHKRRRLKKCHSDSGNDTRVSSDDSADEGRSPSTVSACPIGSALLNKTSFDSYKIAQAEECDVDIFSTKLYRNLTPGIVDKGMLAVMNCLELSEQTTQHVVRFLGGGSEESEKEVKSKIGNGRTCIARSPTVSTIKELLRPCQPNNVPPLKEYQLTGIHWLLALHEQKRFAILADDMGLGKTAQTITFLNFLYSTDQLTEPSVVVCPATLVDNWIVELGKWAPNLRSLKYQGGQQERRELIFGYLVVDEAHNLKNSTSQLYRHIKRHIVSERRLLLTGSPIQNEINELQNLLLLLLPNSLDANTLQLATSTYVQHRDRIKQQCKSQSSESESSPTSTQNLSNINGVFNDNSKIPLEIEFLQQVFAPFILRRLKIEVINDLPAKISIVDRCTLEGRQKKLYLAELVGADSELARHELSRMTVELRDDTNSDDLGEDSTAKRPASSLDCSSSSSSPHSIARRPHLKSKRFIQNLMFRLRRICNHPLLYKGYYTPHQIEEICQYYHTKVEGYRDQPYERVKSIIDSWSDYEIHQAACDFSSLSSLKVPDEEFLASTKIRRMLEIVDQTQQRQAKALIFSQFTTYLDVIADTLTLHRANLSFFRLDGSTLMADRHRMINQFGTDPNVSLFLLSTKAGGVGLNLTAADTVILMDQDWNPHNDRQAEDRVHRLGQTKPVTVYRLCCRESLEESILRIRDDWHITKKLLRCAKRKLYLDQAFGGNTDLLSAAILKDCFSSTLVASAEKNLTDKKDTSASTKAPPKSTETNQHGKQDGAEEKPKQRMLESSAELDEAKIAHIPNSVQSSTSSNESPSNQEDLRLKSSRPDLNSSKKKQQHEDTSGQQTAAGTPRKDALLNRFGGCKVAAQKQDNRKRKRHDESKEKSKKKVKKLSK